MNTNKQTRSVRCWRCGKKFPEGTHVRKIGESLYIDKYEHVRSHWEEEHSK